MQAAFYKRQINSLLSMVDAGKGVESDSDHVLSTSYFLDANHLAKEKAMFSRLPILIGHSSEVADVGDFIVREHQDISWLIVRGKDKVVRAFMNYCQHRGTKLEQQESGCKRRFSCPYHAWTYDAQGHLIGVPRSDLFPNLDKQKKGLKQGKLEEAFGFLWLTVSPRDEVSIQQYLGGLTEELEALDLGSYHVFYDRTRDLDANWKLPIFAFLESYHISVLHKDSIADFFIENIALSEHFGPHIRSFVPRKTVTELANADLEAVNMSDHVTPTNILFPNICMIAHPTSMTVICMFPGETPGTSTWRHILLVPKKPQTDAEQAHYDKTVAVLDGMTYENEDFWISEQLQQGINAGAIDELVLGKNEFLLKVFNDSVLSYLEDLPSNT